jgi:leucyl aminopeptidase
LLLQKKHWINSFIIINPWGFLFVRELFMQWRFNVDSPDNLVPITIIDNEKYEKWFRKQLKRVQKWLEESGFIPKIGNFSLMPSPKGGVERVLIITENGGNIWSLADMPYKLPEANCYYIDYTEVVISDYALQQMMIGWGLGCYRYSEYKESERSFARLRIPSRCFPDSIENVVNGVAFVRDLINTPTSDMNTQELVEIAQMIADRFQADLMEISDIELLEQLYPGTYTVGKASESIPRVIDMRWGDKDKPKVTLIGKGVMFDSGGLNIKPENSMKNMKADMAGAACVLGLAHMIMTANLPIRLRVIIPIAENAIAGNAYRPGDIIRYRNGMTVEIFSTDAEGRLLLADALIEAASDGTDLIMDFATLTGAARVALGTEISALFTNSPQYAEKILHFAAQESDPIWMLPLYEQYRNLLKSDIADMSNCSEKRYGGAITAALFLKSFVPDNIPWIHFDIPGTNEEAKPGRPVGGEASAVRAVFEFLKQTFAQCH